MTDTTLLDKDEWLSPAEVATKFNLSRQAVYLAIKKGLLKTPKYKGRFLIHKDEARRWQSNKYDRTKSTVNGEPLFDPKKGRFSVSQLSKYLSMNMNRIYYLLRIGKIPYEQIGGVKVITMTLEEIKALKEEEHAFPLERQNIS